MDQGKTTLPGAIDQHPAAFGGAQQGARLVTAEMRGDDLNEHLAKEGTKKRTRQDND